MNAVIVGCGKVGGELAKTLVNDGHSVSVIDSHQKALDEISGEMDVMTFLGNGSDLEVLTDAGLKEADIFISVTDSDELNLLTCLMAKEASRCETIARVRNPLYSREVEFFKARLGLSKIINPEHLAATEIFNLLQFPALSRIDFFEGSEVTIAVVHAKKGFKFAGKSLVNIMRENPEMSNMLICAVLRGSESIIPRGDFVLEEGDDFTIVAEREDIRRFVKAAGISNNPTDEVLIVGAGTISYYLTQELIKRRKKVRIIDNDDKKCEFFSERFPEAEIIKGDGTDRSFLIKQGLLSAGAFVPLTGIDEENLVVATYAKNYSDAKVITKINRTDMSDLIKTLDVDSVVFPKLICAEIIAQYVRAMEAGLGGNVATIFRYLDEAFEVLEFKAISGSRVIGVQVKDMKLKNNVILAGIISEGKYHVPSGQSVISENDRVIVVSTDAGLNTLDGILM